MIKYLSSAILIPKDKLFQSRLKRWKFPIHRGITEILLYKVNKSLILFHSYKSKMFRLIHLFSKEKYTHNFKNNLLIYLYLLIVIYYLYLLIFIYITLKT